MVKGKLFGSIPVGPLLLFALPFGGAALLAWWLWSKRSGANASPATPLLKSSEYPVGSTVTIPQGTFTKQSDAAIVPDGTPGAVETWTAADGSQVCPTLAFSQGTSGPAFLPLS